MIALLLAGLIAVTVSAAAAADEPPVLREERPFKSSVIPAEALQPPYESPNPYLAFLPSEAEPDWELWRARAAERGRQRRALRGPAPPVPEVFETEAPGVVGLNDLPILAESVPDFGLPIAAGGIAAVDLIGRLIPVATDLLGASDSDDSIPQAVVLPILDGEVVRRPGSIGDGDYGSSGPTPLGDVDVYAIVADAGQTIDVTVSTEVPLGDLDPICALYDAAGTFVAFNDDAPQSIAETLDCRLVYDPPAAGTYYFVVVGTQPQLPADASLPSDPFTPGTAPGVGSEGSYTLEVALGEILADVDFFRVDLRAGDVIGATVDGRGGEVGVYSLANQELTTGRFDLSFIHPPSSPLPGGGRASFSRVIEADGPYAIVVRSPPPRVFEEEETYRATLQLFRPPLTETTEPQRQILFLDFDGATFDGSLFDFPPGLLTLSPLSAFLGDWGIPASAESALIDLILEETERLLCDEIRHLGAGGDFQTSGIPGEFDLELRNSRDHEDPGDDPLVSRVVIGGTIDEFAGVATIGLAQSIDVGNFATGEIAVVLTDLLSEEPDNANSLNGVERAPGVSKRSLVAAALARIAVHEAGHIFANFHTERDVGPTVVMDSGGRLDLFLGLGEDEIFGTEDDVDVSFGPDEYSRREGFLGVERTLDSVSLALAAGGERSRVTARPATVDFGPLPTGANTTRSIFLSNAGNRDLQIQATTLSGDAAFVALSGLGAGALAPGDAREVQIRFAPTALSAYEAFLEIESDDPEGDLVIVLSGQGGLPQGSYAPSSLDFGDLTYGDVDSTTTASLTVSNQGDFDLMIDGAAAYGENPEAFELSADRSLPIRVAAGEDLQVDLSFRPAGAVGELNALFVLTDNDPATPGFELPVTGRALGPDLALDPPPPFFGFGLVEVGEDRTRTFQVLNEGNRTLEVFTTELTGEDADELTIIGGGAPFSVEPGEAHDLQIRAAPLETGTRIADLEIVSDDPDESETTLRIFVSAISAEISVVPEIIEFETIEPGAEVREVVTVTNLGLARLTGEPSQILGDGPFEITSGGGPFALIDGGRRLIEIAFRPQEAGSHYALLRITTDDPERPIVDVVLIGFAGAVVDVPTLKLPGAALLILLLIAAGGRALRRRPQA